MKPTCETCRYWARIYVAISGINGDCRLNPPTITNDNASTWPKTRPHDWCGRYSKKITNQ